MKAWLLLLLVFLFLPIAHAQVTPDCVIGFNFTAAGNNSSVTGCGRNVIGVVDWRVVYFANGFSALSLVVQSAPDSNGSPGTWVNFAGTVVSPGINPNTSTTNASTEFTGYFPWMRVHLTSVSGSGNVSGVLYGCRSPGCAGSASTSGPSGVTSVATGCGLTGGPITTTGTISSSWQANAQTGTSYTIQTTDCGKQLTFSNSSAIAAALPQAGTSFPNGWFTIAKNIGAGDVTITPTTSTISGAASIILSTGEFAIITSDGTNYEGDSNRLTQGTNVTLVKSRTATQVSSSNSGGTVTSIAFGCGLSGGTITASGSVARSEAVNPQTGTSYSFADSDCGKLVQVNNSSAVAVALPQAGSGGTFIAGWLTDITNEGAGTITITPTISTIDGAASLTLTTNQGVRIVSNGTNYFTVRGGSVPGSGSVTSIATGCGLTGGTITTTGTISANESTNPQSGTSYATANSDCGKIVKFTNAANVAVTLTTSGITTGWFADFAYTGTSVVTFTPASGTINGASTLQIVGNQGAHIVFDGTNFSAHSPQSYALISQAGSLVAKRQQVNFLGSINCVDNAGALRTDCTGASTVYTFGGGFLNNGNALTAPTISLPVTSPVACTIIAWDISIGAADSGTATVKFLKIATGTASPGSGNSINTSGVSLATGTHVRSTTLTDFTTTAVSAGDIIAVDLTATATNVGVTANIECQ